MIISRSDHPQDPLRPLPQRVLTLPGRVLHPLVGAGCQKDQVRNLELPAPPNPLGMRRGAGGNGGVWVECTHEIRERPGAAPPEGTRRVATGRGHDGAGSAPPPQTSECASVAFVKSSYSKPGNITVSGPFQHIIKPKGGGGRGNPDFLGLGVCSGAALWDGAPPRGICGRVRVDRVRTEGKSRTRAGQESVLWENSRRGAWWQK